MCNIAKRNLISIITTDLIKYLFYVSGKRSDLIVSYAYSLTSKVKLIKYILFLFFDSRSSYFMNSLIITTYFSERLNVAILLTARSRLFL